MEYPKAIKSHLDRIEISILPTTVERLEVIEEGQYPQLLA